MGAKNASSKPFSAKTSPKWAAGRLRLTLHLWPTIPFLNRYIVGTGINYNLTEIFAVEMNMDFSPDLGDTDWKPLTKQLIEENPSVPTFQSSPTLDRQLSCSLRYTGKVAVVGRRIINFDIFAAFGMGVTRTSDDLEALDTEARRRPRGGHATPDASHHQLWWWCGSSSTKTSPSASKAGLWFTSKRSTRRPWR